MGTNQAKSEQKTHSKRFFSKRENELKLDRLLHRAAKRDRGMAHSNLSKVDNQPTK